MMAAQPATSRLLLTSLCEFLEAEVRDYPFPSVDGSPCDCRIFLYGLPEGLEEKTYPFVIARWTEGEITNEPGGDSILRDTVVLALGVYSPKSPAQAGILLAELLDCVRRALWKTRIVGGRFQLLEPLRCQIVEAERQQHKFHLASIETVWNYVWPPQTLHEAGLSQMGPDISGATSSQSTIEAILAKKRGEKA